MTTIKLRRDTAANWLAADPVLALAEPGLETDTNKIKYGDGSTSWAGLPYASGGASTSTRWDLTSQGNGCPISAELTSEHFEAFTEQSNLGIRSDGSWNIGSNYNGTGLYGLGNTATLYSNYGDVAIRVNESQSYFTFGADGKLTLPNGASIGSSGSLSGIPMTTTRGTILLGNIAECIGGENHFHIMKQDPGLVDLFLGDDTNYVKLPGNQGGETAYGVEIGTNVGSAYTWRFDTNGTFILPPDKLIKYPDGTVYGGGGGGSSVNIDIDGGYYNSTYDETDLVLDGGGPV